MKPKRGGEAIKRDPGLGPNPWGYNPVCETEKGVGGGSKTQTWKAATSEPNFVHEGCR